MDRKTFFKTLLGGAAVAVIAPGMLAKEGSEYGVAVDVATIPKKMTISELSRYYRETGTVPYPVHSFYLDEKTMGELYRRYSTMDLFETLDSISGRGL